MASGDDIRWDEMGRPAPIGTTPKRWRPRFGAPLGLLGSRGHLPDAARHRAAVPTASRWVRTTPYEASALERNQEIRFPGPGSVALGRRRRTDQAVGRP
jgi:hypothetical protein